MPHQCGTLSPQSDSSARRQQPGKGQGVEHQGVVDLAAAHQLGDRFLSDKLHVDPFERVRARLGHAPAALGHKQVACVVEERRDMGLEGLVGGLNCVIINTEPDRQEKAVQEFLDRTGYNLSEGFEDESTTTYVLRLKNSVDFLIQSRKNPTPFESVEKYPKARHLPQTRMETLVFETTDLSPYVETQKRRHILFLTEQLVHRYHL